MSVLVIAEHDNQTLKSSTRNTITAASQLGDDMQVLVIGHHAQAAADWRRPVHMLSPPLPPLAKI